MYFRCCFQGFDVSWRWVGGKSRQALGQSRQNNHTVKMCVYVYVFVHVQP